MIKKIAIVILLLIAAVFAYSIYSGHFTESISATINEHELQDPFLKGIAAVGAVFLTIGILIGVVVLLFFVFSIVGMTLFFVFVFVGLLMLGIALPLLLPVLLPLVILFSILVIKGRRKQKRGNKANTKLRVK